MFQRMYKDESEWQEVTEKEVRYRLDGYYQSIDLAIELLKKGIQHDTPFAIFRWIESEYPMTKDERRAIRRECINKCLQWRAERRDNTTGHNSIVFFVRLWEISTFGYELRIY